MLKNGMERKVKLFFLVPIIILFGSFSLLSVLAPILEKYQLLISQDIYSFLHNICHQLPTRCFWIMDRPFGLCARCFGLYSSLTVISLYLIFKRTQLMHWRYSIYLIAPFIIEPIMEMLGVWKGTLWVRFLTGLLSGVGLIFLYFLFVSKLYKRFKGNN